MHALQQSDLLYKCKDLQKKWQMMFVYLCVSASLSACACLPAQKQLLMRKCVFFCWCVQVRRWVWLLQHKSSLKLKNMAGSVIETTRCSVENLSENRRQKRKSWRKFLKQVGFILLLCYFWRFYQPHTFWWALAGSNVDIRTQSLFSLNKMLKMEQTKRRDSVFWP